jgi:hypothetical protein
MKGEAEVNEQRCNTLRLTHAAMATYYLIAVHSLGICVEAPEAQ